MQVVKLGARPWLPPAASLIVRLGFWHWAKTILVPAYTAKVVAEKRSVGNHSDLYPTLAGCARIAFARSGPPRRGGHAADRNRFYGRPLDPKNPGDPTAREAFWVPTRCFLRRAMTKAAFACQIWQWFAATVLAICPLFFSSARLLRESLYIGPGSSSSDAAGRSDFPFPR
jgi:hypothetical protein